MSRPQKIHKPIKLDFNSLLGAVARGKGRAKRVAPKPSGGSNKVGAIKPPDKK
jgi:hypothetical protein